MGMETHQERVEVSSGVFDLITLFSVQPFENNVYVLVDPDSTQCLVIDASEAQPILDATVGRRVEAVLVSHGHWDHHNELPQLRERLTAPVGIAPADTEMLKAPPSFAIEDGQQFRFGPHTLTAISTPGHTPGSTCFLVGHVLLSGDTLFPGGPGNTSNRYGNFELIIESIRSRLFTLPEETRVLPGHGKATTIGAERPHLEEWIARGW